MGCDNANLYLNDCDELISIHAPIVGCDMLDVILLMLDHYFNPRTHRGVRLKRIIHKVYCTRFQSTHPSWGATILSSQGCDNIFNFNPRTHRGVRRGARGNITRLIQISIHAPIVGCDETLFGKSANKLKFQSTHPSWGATVLEAISHD